MPLSTRIREAIRNQWAGLIALFLVVTGGTAYALDGSNTVFSDDIVNGQVRSGDVADDTTPFALQGVDITNQSIGLADLAANSVGGAKVVDNSLTGADINESTLNVAQHPLSLALDGDAQEQAPLVTIHGVALTASCGVVGLFDPALRVTAPADGIGTVAEIYAPFGQAAVDSETLTPGEVRTASVPASTADGNSGLHQWITYERANGKLVLFDVMVFATDSGDGSTADDCHYQGFAQYTP